MILVVDDFEVLIFIRDGEGGSRSAIELHQCFGDVSERLVGLIERDLVEVVLDDSSDLKSGHARLTDKARSLAWIAKDQAIRDAPLIFGGDGYETFCEPGDPTLYTLHHKTPVAPRPAVFWTRKMELRASSAIYLFLRYCVGAYDPPARGGTVIPIKPV